ncbi:MAG TPA: bifunctional hydroxymethylpyrimidine kinase/phosphomethylpyrimidine kinase [Gemmatimonadaceae bacterium]|nr:bifunctional hydroxymethylpyrimidine kinase/phosphomethylpyrimidine kinase [Gemmatimonadaceae bacterium]
MTPDRIPVVLAIAGSDPSGGAGLQADLKTAAALGVFGAAAVTLLTVQSTRAITDVSLVDPDLVRRQVDAVFDDGPVDAIKIGALGSGAIAGAVADVLDARPGVPVVLDPVLRATSGGSLLADEAFGVLRTRLFPRATVITPNLDEAGALLGAPAPGSVTEMRAAAAELRARFGVSAVLLKGGHLPGNVATDVLDDGGASVELSRPRISTERVHGAGCSLSSAIAARLAHGDALAGACDFATGWVAGAIAAGAPLDATRGARVLFHGYRA